MQVPARAAPTEPVISTERRPWRLVLQVAATAERGTCRSHGVGLCRWSTDWTAQPSQGIMKALDALKAAPPEVRAAALAVLDQVSAPLTERQLASAFRAQGIGLLDAKRMARALRKLNIIAVAPRGP